MTARIATDPVSRLTATSNVSTRGEHPGHHVTMRFAERLGWFYVPGTALVILVAFGLGAAHADAPCTPQSVDCDLGPLFGLIWALIALVAWIGVVVAAELLLRARSQK